MINHIKKFIDLVVPRFITEDVAFYNDGTQWIPMFPVSELTPEDEYHAVGTIHSFNLFGYGIGGKVVDWKVV